MVTFTCIGGHNQGKIPQNHHVRRNIMKKFSIIAMVFMLTASLLTGCRRPDAGYPGKISAAFPFEEMPLPLGLSDSPG